ncbi:MAG: hypothetical protein ACYTFW_07205 [Planctomycetota bacterium]
MTTGQTTLLSLTFLNLLHQTSKSNYDGYLFEDFPQCSESQWFYRICHEQFLPNPPVFAMDGNKALDPIPDIFKPLKGCLYYVLSVQPHVETYIMTERKIRTYFSKLVRFPIRL